MGIFTSKNTIEECPLCKKMVESYDCFADDHICTQEEEQKKGIRLTKKTLGNIKKFVDYEINPVIREIRLVKASASVTEVERLDYFHRTGYLYL